MIDLRFSDEELERVRDRITTFIRDTVDDAGAVGAVLGLSGGIDSTLTAYLAADALGPDGLKGLILPSTVTDSANVSDAERIATTLGIDYEIVDIDPMVSAIVDGVPDAADDRLAVGNTRARVRAVLNYCIANHENRVVLGTGNRSEAAVGYFTKYGDGAVDCHPIGDLYKMQVRQLAASMDVPTELVEKTPTAELWSDQTDEEELGVSYDTLDAILALHVDGPLSTAATCRIVGCDRELVERVDRMYERSEHKRTAPPAPSVR